MAEPSQWVNFVEVPGILLIRLMSRCNEKCLFCMVADEIALSDDVDFEEAKKRIAGQPVETQIEFFGGEPTIYPRFLDLLAFARQRGHRCSIASNMRIFHSARYTARVAALGADQIYIRTSLYGDDERLHDYYTDTPGSFQQTARGIQNALAAGFLCQVNVVILKQNVDRLREIARLVHSWGVPRIKFGNLIYLSTCAEHAVALSVVRPRLRAAVELAEALGLQVTVEKTPICVASGRIDLFSTEREIYGGVRAFDDDGQCARCLVRRWCDGLDPDYVQRFGYDGIQRLGEVPPVVVKGTAFAGPEPELLKMHCIEVPDGALDEPTMQAMLDLSLQVAAKHGRLAAFRSSHLKA